MRRTEQELSAKRQVVVRRLRQLFVTNLVFFLLWFGAYVLSIWTVTEWMDLRILMPQERHHLATLRSDALNGKRTRLPEMIALLDSDRTGSAGTGLHAVSHLAAAEALPAVERVMRSSRSSGLRLRARIARARLLAELEAETFSQPKAKAPAKVRRFLSEARLGPSRINLGVGVYHWTRKRGRLLATTHSSQGWPVEMYAMNELADMVYREGYEAYRDVPQLHQINFDQDPDCARKIRLARLPRPVRIRRLIDELAHWTIFNGDELRPLQLAIDEGLPASRAAARKLRQMKSRRGEYRANGFGALFRVIEGVGDMQQASLVKSFEHDGDPHVAHYANQQRVSLHQRLRTQRAAGY